MTRESDQLAAMYAEHQAQLHALIRRRFDTDVADDATGETWAIVARLGAGHVQAATASAFLHRVAFHEALRITRSGAPRGAQAPISLQRLAEQRRRGGRLHEPPADEYPVPDAHADTPAQALENLQLAEMLDGIAHLSRGQQIALIGRIVGLSYDEIGEAGGHPTSQRISQTGRANTWANRKLTEGRKALRERLGGDQG